MWNIVVNELNDNTEIIEWNYKNRIKKYIQIGLAENNVSKTILELLQISRLWIEFAG